MEGKRVAIVCANGIGDALLSMILTHNLSLAGAQVVTFSTLLCQLESWFPNKTISSFPDDFSIFSDFDTVIAADHARVHSEHNFGNELIILKENTFEKKKTFAWNLQQRCLQRFHVQNATTETGITPPSHLKWRAHPKRIVLHPTSTEEKRTWHKEKFHKLAEKLQRRGYEPVFCVAPHERDEWPTSPSFNSIADVATFIYESGYLIGNNSGLGHIASALHIPTVSLFAKKSYANLWRPGWGPGVVVTPPPIVPFGPLRQKSWKALLSPPRVLRGLEALISSI